MTAHELLRDFKNDAEIDAEIDAIERSIRQDMLASHPLWLKAIDEAAAAFDEQASQFAAPYKAKESE